MSKTYLRYVAGECLGVVTSKKGACKLVGRTVISPCLEDVVVWDLKTSSKVCRLSGEGSEVSAVSVVGDQLAVGRDNGCVEVWGMVDYNLLISFRGHKSAITCAIFDESATRLVSGSKDTDIVVWDLITEAGLYRLKGHKAPITDVRLLASGNVLISSSRDGVVKLWDLLTQHCFETLVGHRGEVTSIEMICGGSKLVTASNHHKLRVFSVSETSEDKVPVEVLEEDSVSLKSKEKPLMIISDSSDNYLACLCADSTIEVYEILGADKHSKSVRKRQRKSGVQFKLMACFKPSAKARSCDIVKFKGQLQVLAALQNNSLELYSIEDGSKKLLHCLSAPGHRSDIRTVCFSSDDTMILTGSSNILKVYRRSTLLCVCTLTSGYALCSAFIPGNRHVAIGTKSGSVQLFELASNLCLEEVSAHDGTLWALTLTADQRGLVTGGADKTIKFWEFELIQRQDNQPGKRLTLNHTKTVQLSEDVLALSCSSDQRLLAVALLDCTIKVFFADSLKFFLSLYGHKLPVLSLDISSDSTLLVSSSADKNIRIWGLDFGDCHKSIFAHDDSIMCVKFIPNTHLLFSGSKDTSIKCWDADHFQHIQTLKGHSGEVWCIAVSNDGTTMVSGSHDNSLRLWERTQEPLILSEEREMEREKFLEQLSGMDVSETVIPGESHGEALLPSIKTQHTISAVDRLLEAIEVWRGEREKMREHKEACKLADRVLPCPELHPVLVAMGNIEPKRHALNILRKIKSSELEECLLVMTFDQVVQFLELIEEWLEMGWEVELICRCLFFLMRVHHTQIINTADLRPLITSLSTKSRHHVKKLKDLYGFNLEALKCVQREVSKKETFSDHHQIMRL